MMLITAVFLLSAATLLVVQGGRSRIELSTAPAGWAGTLSSAEQRLSRGDTVEIRLEDGVYHGPWFFGRQHSGLIIRGGPGVVVRANGNQEALVTVDAGCTQVQLQSLRLEATGLSALRVGHGASVRVLGVRVQGGLRLAEVEGGHLSLRGVSAADLAEGVVLHGGTFEADELLLAGSGTLVQGNGTMLLTRSRLVGLGGDALATVLRISGGSLQAEALAIEAEGCLVGLTADAGSSLELSDVVVHGARTGLRCFRAKVPRVQGLEVVARDVGLHWDGPWDMLWRWEDQRIEAPLPLRGEAVSGLPFDGRGADHSRLLRLPRFHS